MIWLVPNNLFWLVSVNHFWLVNGLGPVRSDSGVFVCDRFFAFGNSWLFPERGSLMSDSEMNGARFDMANKDVILSFELRLFWSSLLHCIDKYLWHQRLHSWNAVFAVPWSSCVIGLKWRHQSGVGADSMLTLSLILMTYTEIREHWLTWPVVPSVVPHDGRYVPIYQYPEPRGTGSRHTNTYTRKRTVPRQQQKSHNVVTTCLTHEQLSI